MGCNEFSVIVSHPARQQSVYQWPMAMQEAGMPVKFLTGIYYKRDSFPYSLVKFLPATLRASVLDKLQKRQMPALDSSVVLSFPWFELAFRPFGQIGLWNRAHDLLVSAWISSISQVAAPTIVHCFQGAGLYTLRAAKKKGIITVLEVTCALSAHRILSAEYRRLGLLPTVDSPTRAELAEVLETDYVVGQSKFAVDSLLEYGVPPGKIILLPLGVDIERFHPAVRQDHYHPFRVLFVGQLDIRKGLHHLLETCNSLQLPNAELVLAGQVTNQHGHELLHKYEGTYRWLGFVPHNELPKVYQGSDIFVFPSLAEGSSNATYEALASGLPSVVTTSSGAVVRDGVEGYVIYPGELDALKDRIQRLYLDSDLRERMGMAARRRAEQYTWQHFGRRLRLMYERICRGTLGSTDILDMTDR